MIFFKKKVAKDFHHLLIKEKSLTSTDQNEKKSDVQDYSPNIT
jgi:hypothetical protein